MYSNAHCITSMADHSKKNGTTHGAIAAWRCCAGRGRSAGLSNISRSLRWNTMYGGNAKCNQKTGEIPNFVELVQRANNMQQQRQFAEEVSRRFLPKSKENSVENSQKTHVIPNSLRIDVIPKLLRRSFAKNPETVPKAPELWQARHLHLLLPAKKFCFRFHFPPRRRTHFYSLFKEPRRKQTFFPHISSSLLFTTTIHYPTMSEVDTGAAVSFLLPCLILYCIALHCSLPT